LGRGPNDGGLQSGRRLPPVGDNLGSGPRLFRSESKIVLAVAYNPPVEIYMIIHIYNHMYFHLYLFSMVFHLVNHMKSLQNRLKSMEIYIHFFLVIYVDNHLDFHLDLFNGEYYT